MPNTAIAEPTIKRSRVIGETPRLFVGLVLCSIALALIPTLWPELDVWAAAWFTGAQPRVASVHWWWVEWINYYVPTAFRWGIGLSALGWVAATWAQRSLALRKGLALFVIAGILGPGAAVNWGFKDHWQRARPYQVQQFGGTAQFTRATVMTDQCEANCSFVSGHVACGIFFAGFMLVHRRRKVQWAVAGCVAGWIIGFARMSDVAHWLSDVLWAFPITLAVSWLVWFALERAYRTSPSRTES
jgi:lipid A 4'-phosphatase